MKKFLVALVAAMLCLPIAYGATTVEKIGDLYYELDSETMTAKVVVGKYVSDGSSTDVFYNSNSMLDSVVIPEMVKGEYVVTEIDTRAFVKERKYYSSKSGTVYSDFENRTLSYLSLPRNIMIGEKAFESCKSLNKVELGDNVNVGGYAFFGCPISELRIPSGTRIGERAFQSCKSLNKVELGDNVNVGGYAFSNSGVSEISFGKNDTLGDCAFSMCDSLIEVFIPSDKDVIFRSSNFFSNCKNLQKVTLTDDRDNIPYGMFSGCTSLHTVPMICAGKKKITINSRAFSGCTSLTSFSFPENLPINIGDEAFSDCTSLTTVSLPVHTSIGNKAFYKCTSLGTVSLSDSVSVGDYAFYGCNKLSCDLSEQKEVSIGEYAFAGCYKIILPKGVKVVGKEYNNVSFITLPEGVETIEDYVFYNNLDKSVTIPSSVKYIGKGNFKNAWKVFFKTNTPPEIGDWAFENVIIYYTATDTPYPVGDSTTIHKVYNLLSSKFEYKGFSYIPTSMSERTCDLVDVDYLGIAIERIPETAKLKNSTGREFEFKIKNINDYALYKFYYSKSDFRNDYWSGVKQSVANSFYIDCQVDNIGIHAFDSVPLYNLVFPEKIGNIGNYAFNECRRLCKLTFPKDLNRIGEYAFNNCDLYDISFQNIKVIGNYAFNNCKYLRRVYSATPHYYEDYGERYSYDRKKKYEIELPASLDTIGIGAFNNCKFGYENEYGSDKLRIMIADSDKELYLGYLSKDEKGGIGKGTFGDALFTHLYIGRPLAYDTSATAGYSPFYSSSVLDTVTTGLGCTFIPDYAFYDCRSLKSVSLSDGVESIGKYAFSGDAQIEAFEIGKNVKTIDEEAFSDCTGMRSLKSYSKEPAVCGAMALDDINKMECELFVPEGTEDAYRSAEQWKEFFMITADLTERCIIDTKVSEDCIEMGTADATNNYNYCVGDVATLTAYPIDNDYMFVAWSDGNKENPRKLVVKKSDTYYAVFAKKARFDKTDAIPIYGAIGDLEIVVTETTIDVSFPAEGDDKYYLVTLYRDSVVAGEIWFDAVGKVMHSTLRSENIVQGYKFTISELLPEEGYTMNIKAYNGKGELLKEYSKEFKTGKAVDDNAVPMIESDSEIVGIEYYSTTGQRIKQPVRGINIVKCRYSDERTEVHKILVK